MNVSDASDQDPYGLFRPPDEAGSDAPAEPEQAPPASPPATDWAWGIPDVEDRQPELGAPPPAPDHVPDTDFPWGSTEELDGATAPVPAWPAAAGAAAGTDPVPPARPPAEPARSGPGDDAWRPYAPVPGPTRFAAPTGAVPVAAAPPGSRPAAEPIRFEPSPPRRRRWPVVLGALLAGLIGAAAAVAGLLGLGVLERPPTESAAPTTTVAVTTPPTTTPAVIINPTDEVNIAAAVGRKVVPSVVNVKIGTSTGGTFAEFGSGSGVVISADGLIVTNDHVVADSDQIRVVLADGRQYPAELVGTDPLTDLAVIRIPTSGLPAIEFGAADEMVVGDVAIAVGNPLGLDGGPTLTVGVISAFARQVITDGSRQPLVGMIQTDAPFTRGSSGGALVDSQGRLIGITTAIGVGDGLGAGDVGFATPIEMVQRITTEIIDSGAVAHAYLGITGDDFMTELEDGAEAPAGAVIISVQPGTAAEGAGLQPGDRITRYNGEPVRTMNELVLGIRLYRVGQEVEFEYIRAGEVLTTTVTLGQRPAGL